MGSIKRFYDYFDINDAIDIILLRMIIRDRSRRTGTPADPFLMGSAGVDALRLLATPLPHSDTLRYNIYSIVNANECAKH